MSTFILGKISGCAYLNRTFADVLIIMQYCVTLVAFKSRKCGP